MAQTLPTDEIIFYTRGNGSTKRDKYKKTPDKKKRGSHIHDPGAQRGNI